jgi:hypothetical protein
LDLGELESREYWKDRALQDARFPILLEEGIESGEMLCQVLAAAWALAGPWTVLSVGEPFATGWEFVAIADHRNADVKIPGVEWMRISMFLESSGPAE